MNKKILEIFVCILLIFISSHSLVNGENISTLENKIVENENTKTVNTVQTHISNGGWNRTFGGFGWDAGMSVQQTSDGGYVIVGGTESFGAGDVDVWLLKINALGVKEWDRTFGGSQSDTGWSVQQTSDNGFIIAGGTMSFGAGDYDFWLIKTDNNGIEVWNQTFGGDKVDIGYSVLETNDYGFIMLGITESFGAGWFDFWLIKTDNNGIEVWNQTFGGSDWEWGCSVQQTSDNGYIMTGDTMSFGAGDTDVWLIKTDEDGSELWNTTFGEKKADMGYSVKEMQDGGYVLTGATGPLATPDVWLIKTNSLGIKEWEKTFGGEKSDAGCSLQQTSDGGFIVAGWTESFSMGARDIWLIKTDSDGNEVWDMTFGGEKMEHLWVDQTVQQTSDGGFVITAWTESFGAGKSDLWLIKVSEPSINIEISGGFGVKAVVINHGSEDLSNLKWRSQLEGLVFVVKNSGGVIPSVPAGSKISFTMFVVGIGKGSIRVTAGTVSNTANFFLLGPFVIIR